MSTYAPETRVLVRDALPALGSLAFFLFAWGLMHGLDAVVRGFFGKVAGAVGWIPIVGTVVSRQFRRTEQKISHYIGRAEHGIDNHIASSWHKLARVAEQMAQSALAVAVTLAFLAKYVATLPKWSEVRHLIFQVTHPLDIRSRSADHTAHRAHARAKAAQAGATRVGHRVRVDEARAASLEGSRRRTRVARREAVQDAAIARLYRWMRHRSIPLTTGAFLGAFAWALGRYGVGWIRCSNWKRLGRAVCRLPSSTITSLLGLLALVWAISDLRRTAEFAEAISEEVTRELVRLVNGPSLPDGRFTIE